MLTAHSSFLFSSFLLILLHILSENSATFLPSLTAPAKDLFPGTVSLSASGRLLITTCGRLRCGLMCVDLWPADGGAADGVTDGVADGALPKLR